MAEIPEGPLIANRLSLSLIARADQHEAGNYRGHPYLLIRDLTTGAGILCDSADAGELLAYLQAPAVLDGMEMLEVVDAELASLRAENARLREALKTMVSLCDGLYLADDSGGIYFHEEFSNEYQAAIAALSPEQPDADN